MIKIYNKKGIPVHWDGQGQYHKEKHIRLVRKAKPNEQGVLCTTPQEAIRLAQGET